MFTFGGSELLIVVVLALLLFGPDKIPQLARTIGRFTREFNKYKDIMESTVRAEIYRAEGRRRRGRGPDRRPHREGRRRGHASFATRWRRLRGRAARDRAGACEPAASDAIPFTVTDEADEEEEE